MGSNTTAQNIIKPTLDFLFSNMKPLIIGGKITRPDLYLKKMTMIITSEMIVDFSSQGLPPS